MSVIKPMCPFCPADGSVKVSEFAASWVSEHFGTDKDGQALASALDVNFDWLVTTAETDVLLQRYDSNGQ